MTFDVRWPVGLLFLTIGVLVAATGLFGARPAGPNIDLDWGAAMIVFGAAMVVLAALAKRAGDAQANPSSTPSPSSPAWCRRPIVPRLEQ